MQPDDPILHPETLAALQTGEFTVQGQFMWGSNHTFLADVACAGRALKAVYKPTLGERPLWDFPVESLAGREVAAYLVSEAGGWHMVPPTVFRADGPAGRGSLQLYVEHDPELHYFNFTPEQRARLMPVALFDAVVNNTDRKGGHVLVGPDERFWLIDHGICFHVQPKLRTVIWDFAGQAIPEDEIERLKALRTQLAGEASLRRDLEPHLSEAEVGATLARIDALLAARRFPRPTNDRYSYPWPPV
ncbi:MAG: SCO1664 family protein [Chloroflexi bacterium]|nr:SCO1664 family protein [Chloroflexota bacterium]